MSNVWRLLVVALLSAAVLRPSGAEEGSEILAAKVNGAEITRSALEAQFEAYRNQQNLSLAGIGGPDQFRQLRRKVLDVMIDQELLWQEAQAKGVLVKDESVDAMVAQGRDAQPSQQAWKETLKKADLTEEGLRDDTKRRLSIAKLIREEIAKDAAVSDEEVHAYYAANPELFQMPEEVHARHILLKLPPGSDEATAAATRAKAEKVLAEARGGADFAELARKHSEGPTGSAGGDLGFLGRGRTAPSFEAAAFTLAPGEVSELVETENGLHIIKVEARRGGDVIPETEASPRIRDYLVGQKVSQALQEHVKALRGRAQIEIMM